MIYVLDACAMLALLNKETGRGYEVVKDLFQRTTNENIVLHISIVNLVEVYYRYIQTKGTKIADTIMSSVKDMPVNVIHDIGNEVYFEAARYKAGYSMSLADAFLCATAKSLGATIVTRDSEIKPAEKAEALAVLWIE